MLMGGYVCWKLYYFYKHTNIFLGIFFSSTVFNEDLSTWCYGALAERMGKLCI